MNTTANVLRLPHTVPNVGLGALPLEHAAEDATLVVQPFPTLDAATSELQRPPREWGTLVEQPEPRFA